MLTWLLLAALALLLSAATLRALRTRRSIAAVARRLADPDPAARRQALDLVEREGVALHARALYRAALGETDPTVVDALATLVRRSLWEPGQRPEVVALRRWAAERPVPGVGVGPIGVAGASADAAQTAPTGRSDRSDLVAGLEHILGEELVGLRLRSGDVVVEPLGPSLDRPATSRPPLWWLAERRASSTQAAPPARR